MHKLKSCSPFRSRQRLISWEEAQQLMRNYLEPRLTTLRHQLDRRQAMIAQLNEQLNANDLKLRQQQSIIDRFNVPQHGKLSQINERIRTIEIAINSHKWNQFPQKQFETQIHNAIINAQKGVQIAVEDSKQRNNQYWKRVKQGLGRVSDKLQQIEIRCTTLQTFTEQQKRRRLTEGTLLNQLSTHPNTIRMLRELKSSVGNLLQNHRCIAQVQKQKIAQLSQSHPDPLRSSTLSHPHSQISQYNPTHSQSAGSNQVGSARSDSSQVQKQGKQRVEMKKEGIVLDTAPQEFQSPFLPFSLISSSFFPTTTFPSLPLRGTPLPKDPSEVRGSVHEGEKVSTFHCSRDDFQLSRSHNPTDLKAKLLQWIGDRNDSSQTHVLQLTVDPHIPYLKTLQGKFLFDSNGNMLRYDKEVINSLHRQGLLYFHLPK